MVYSFSNKLGIKRGNLFWGGLNSDCKAFWISKKKKLEDERLKLGEIISTLEAQKDVLLELSDKKENLKNRLNATLENSILDIQFVVGHKNYLERLEQDIKTQFEIIKKRQIELEEQQIQVNEAYKEVKVLEKLKEKQYKNFLFEYEQNQIKELDDITNSRQKKVI